MAPSNNADTPHGEGNPLVKKKPRGRPPTAAILRDGVWFLPPAAIQLAEDRVIQHRTACRLRYRATVEGLRKARPQLMRRKKDELQSTLDGSHATNPERPVGGTRSAVS